MQPSSFTYNTLIRGLCRMAVETDDASASAAAPADRRDRDQDNRGQDQDEDEREGPGGVDVGVGVCTDRDLVPGGADGGAASPGAGSPAVGSPPGILADSADGSGSGGSESALPDGIQEALRVRACAVFLVSVGSRSLTSCCVCGDAHGAVSRWTN